MKLWFDYSTGILLYSEENLFNYDSTSPSSWYNHSIVRELTLFEFVIDDNPSDDDDDDDSDDDSENGLDLIVLIVVLICIGASIGITSIILVRKLNAKKLAGQPNRLKEKKPKKISSKSLKHNPKRNSKNKS